jgi:hypothetical protein
MDNSLSISFFPMKNIGLSENKDQYGIYGLQNSNYSGNWASRINSFSAVRTLRNTSDQGQENKEYC